MPKIQQISYVTSSSFKREENALFSQRAKLRDGTAVKDVLTFHVRSLPINEPLEVDLRVMVQSEVTKAYGQIRVPCIVEHAGLVFSDYSAAGYPGGLTKPMWNALGARFLEETHSSGRRATARAVVAYCDGKSVHTFVGETEGTLATEPRGGREFYWDSVFIPDDPTGKAGGRTYAEIVADSSLGLEYKVLELSQSSRAMLEFIEFLRKQPKDEFWP